MNPKKLNPPSWRMRDSIELDNQDLQEEYKKGYLEGYKEATRIYKEVFEKQDRELYELREDIEKVLIAQTEALLEKIEKEIINCDKWLKEEPLNNYWNGKKNGLEQLKKEITG